MSSTSAPINLANFGTGVSYDGGAGNDSIIGSKGDDVIRGGLGADRVQGKVGNDTFVFVAGDLVGSLGENNGQNGSVDHILDFQGAGTNSKAGYQDKIAFYGYSADAYLRFDRYSTDRVQSGTNPDGSPKYVIKTDTKLQYYQIVDPADESKNGFILVQMADGSDQLNVSKTSSDVVFYQDAVIGTSTGAVTEAGGTKNGTPGIATASGKVTATFDQTAGFKQPDAAAPKGSYGSFVFNSDGTWSYALDNAKPETQGLRAGDTKTETLLVETVDGARATISVTVRGANDVAVITGTSTGAAREDAVLTAKGKLTVSDVDVGESSFEARGADNPIKGTYGSLTIDAAGNWVYALDNASAAVQALKGNETRKESFTVKATDGTLAKISLSVKGTNDAAVITGTSSGSVTEDTTLTTTGTLTVSDVDTGEGSFVAHGAENPVKGTYGKLTIDAAGNWVYALDNASTAVQALKAGETRTDSIVVKTVDGTQAKISVTVTGTNEAAVIAGTNSGSVTEDTALTTTGKLTVSDVDAGNSGQTASFKQPEPSALKGQYGSFTFATDGTWSYALDNANAATQALKAGDTRTETLVVKTLDDTPATITVNIQGQNDMAVITATTPGNSTGTQAPLQEDGSALHSAGTLTVTDIDKDAVTVTLLKAEVIGTGRVPDGLDLASLFHIATDPGLTGSTTTGQLGWSFDAPAGTFDYLGAGETLKLAYTLRPDDGTHGTSGDGVVTIEIIGTNAAPTLSTSAPSAGLVEQGANQPGQALSAVQLTKADVDSLVSYDIARWSQIDSTHFSKAGIYGSAVLDTTLNTLTYTLDDSREATNALAAGTQVHDDFSVRVTDGSLSTEQPVSFSITGSADALPLTSTSLSAAIARASIDTRMASTSSSGQQSNGYSNGASLSADGTKVAFTSNASNLVSGDTSGPDDIFVKDFTTGAITNVTLGGNGYSYGASLSADGTKVAFSSSASNLVSGDTNGQQDIFVKDLTTGAITNVTLSGNSGSYGASLSADGTKVAFYSYASNLVSGDTNGQPDIFVKDLTTGAITNVTLDGNSGSYGASLSSDGTKVAFYSSASNLVSGDTNGPDDIFVKDLTTGAITNVTLGGNGYSNGASLSADGTKVAFSSSASNLVSGDTNGQQDIFVKDLTTGAITNVTLGGNGYSYGASLSSDGTNVAFHSNASNFVSGDTNGASDIFVKDLTTGAITNVTLGGNSGSSGASLSADGTKVAFASNASNLVSGNTNGQNGIFVTNLTTVPEYYGKIGTPLTFAGSYSGDPTLAKTIDLNWGDGQISSLIQAAGSIGFSSTHVYQSGAYTLTETLSDSSGQSSKTFTVRVAADQHRSALVSTSSLEQEGNNQSSSGSLSADGTKVAFHSFASNLVSGDTNGQQPDVFVKDLTTGAITNVTLGGNGYSYGASLSADGTKVAFYSSASNLVSGDTNRQDDIFVKDLTTGAITNVTLDGNSGSYGASLSSDGTKVAFASNASNLVSGDTNGVSDIFVKDLTTGAITNVTLGGNSGSYGASLSSDGTKVAFSSSASNLVSGDTNGQQDIFVKDLTTGAITNVTLGGDSQSYGASLSSDGTKVAFASNASNLVSGDTNGVSDIFVKDLTTGVITNVTLGGNNSSSGASLSSDGTKVAFYSNASNLVSGDTNGASDIFVKDLTTGVITLVSTNALGSSAALGSAGKISVTNDGTVSYDSRSSDLTAGDTNGTSDIFVWHSTPLNNTLTASSATQAAILVGSNGADNTITGSDLADTLIGQYGHNTLTGGAGDDLLTGGVLKDVFVFGPDSGKDTITNFIVSGSERDVLDLRDYHLASVGAITMGDVGSDVVLTITPSNTITLQNVHMAQLTNDHFLLS